ncbi:hypothetical protein GBAR_LOCUS102 [Geodia barretti]|uniref:CCDC92/74 N-terminal domain-containing protein n=1 Tax=Geodia barretti TaxID=519541 RepID=A0AA35QRC8_GEOBA|nr:hypothetical protein GBAR_LOCUS102 [Geodia barretti]
MPRVLVLGLRLAPSSQAGLRGGLTGLAAVKGILYRDINTPLPGSRGRIHWREERTKRERLEESLLLLRQHHKETLEQLHSEAERLQRENRELSFRLIMCRCEQRASSPPSLDLPTDKKAAESEVRQLRQALAEERHRNSRILEMLQSQLQTDEVEGSSRENGQLILEGTDQYQHQGKSGLHPCAPGTSLEVRANFCHRDKQESSQAGNDYIKLPALQPRLPGVWLRGRGDDRPCRRESPELVFLLCSL